LLARSPFLVGETLTLADIAVASQWVCLLQAEEVVRLAAGFPQISYWLARVDALAPAHAAAGLRK
jgi:glutathione S-transferase